MSDSKELLALADATVSEPDPLSDLVSRFAKALLAKLKLAQANGRSGWERDDWETACQQGLLRHLEKGDPRDVAAYCAFMWHHGWIASSSQDVGREATVSARDAMSGADVMIGQIEERFPDWKSYRDLVDCIDVTLHNLRREPR